MGISSTKGNVLKRIQESLSEIARKNGWTLFAVAIFLVIWQLFAQLVIQSNVFLPSPWYSVNELVASQDAILEALRITLIEVLSGFIMGLLVGIPLGIFVSESFIARRIALPWVVFVYSIPAAILAPLFLVWFGVNLFAISLFVAMLSFFPIFISTTTGLASIEEEYQHLGEISGANQWQMLKHIKFWVALPHIFTGIKVGIQLSVVGAVVAEFIASGGGLGRMIITSYNSVNVGLTFGVLAVLLIVAVTYYQVVEFILDTLQPGIDTE